MEFGSEIHCSPNWAEPKVLIQVHILKDASQLSAVSERLQEKTDLFMWSLVQREFIAVRSDNPDNLLLVSDSDENNLLVLLQVSRLKQHGTYRKLSEIKPHVVPLPPDGDSCVTDVRLLLHHPLMIHDLHTAALNANTWLKLNSTHVCGWWLTEVKVVQTRLEI